MHMLFALEFLNISFECLVLLIRTKIKLQTHHTIRSLNRYHKNMFSEAQSNGEGKSDKRKSLTQSSKAVKKVKNVGQIHREGEDDTKLKVVTLELDCTEPGCKRAFKSLGVWRKHLSTYHGQIAYKRLYDNVRHNQHGQTEFLCTECNTMHKSQHSLYQHWRYSHQTGKFECSVCAFVANFRGQVFNHQITIHRLSKYQCPHQGCNKALKSNYDLEQHKRIHSGERRFKCSWNKCESTFNLFENAIKHVRVRHFHLPRSVKKQKELNLIDAREPKVYVQVCNV